ncbi:MAG TPA: phosphoribosylamine--glycine ligase [Actinomycetota bacterium]|jgi:phosphoribosylamine--glycine ligase
MRVLVVGSGGREHALAWGLARSPRVTELVVAPGNAGIAMSARIVPEVAADDVAAVLELCERERPDLVVIGPEAPLVAGLADTLRERGFSVFGPEAAAARLEGSKAFAKELMVEAKVPTARAETFADLGAALAYVDELGGRAVVKADGLAAGKGVTVAADRARAEAALRECLEGGRFGDAGARVVVEEVLEGPEVSAFALVDAHTVAPLALAQDFKRIGEGDTGPNTGGMGAYSPLPWVDASTEDAIWMIVGETVAALRARGITYRGLLYTGLMLTDDGPKVLEYNCRFGDPETEVVVPRIAGDLVDLLEATALDRLGDQKVALLDDAAMTVVLASAGYPESSTSGVAIEGLERAEGVPGATVFHAGTARRGDTVVTAGGRVLAVTGTGATIADARAVAYRAADQIAFDGKTYRRDIAASAARLAGEEEP